ncbi:hypothetical protein Tco_1472768 [Tanacetum coccineum]
MTITIPLVNFDIGHCQNSLAGVYIMFGYPVTSISVRILQKSQENGQSQTNMDTGKEREYKSRENAIKGQQKSNFGQT